MQVQDVSSLWKNSNLAHYKHRRKVVAIVNIENMVSSLLLSGCNLGHRTKSWVSFSCLFTLS
jgi:hypothetical protein